MPEETPELPVSPRAAVRQSADSGDARQEVQIQAPSFLDKLKVHKFKILGGVLGVFVLVGAVFGAYKLGQRKVGPGPQPTPTPGLVATPTPDLTADWKTYTNTKYGYSIKYPLTYKEDLTLLDLSRDNSLWLQNIFFYTTSPLPGGGPEPWISVIVWRKDTDSLEKWLENHSTRESFDSKKIPFVQITLYFGVSDKEEVEIAGSSGFKFTSQTMNGPVGRAVVGKNQYVYEISLWTNNNLKKDPEISKNYQNMLSTFKFTSEEAVGEKVFCQEPRPEVCTMECIQNPPYICGSDGKSYCSTCQACSNQKVEWYVIQDEPCGTE